MASGRILRWPAALIAIMAGVAPAAAQDNAAFSAHESTDFLMCHQTARAMIQMRECDSRDVAYQQAALAKDFARLLARRPGDVAALQAEQDAWKAQTDAQCLVFSRRRGSLNSLRAMDCFRHETIAREIAIEAELAR